MVDDDGLEYAVPHYRDPGKTARIADWHRQLKDPSLADAILDRLVHGATRFELRGASMRIEDAGPEP